MSQAIKVGIFLTVSLVILGWFVLRIEDLRLFAPEGQRVDALFESVAGLDEKSAVRVAGVRVGTVEAIGLDGSRARVTLLLEEPVELTAAARAEIASMGLLGDKYVRLDPGPPEAAPLPPDTPIPGTTPPTFDEAIARLNDVADSITGVTRSISGQGQQTTISRLLDNLEETSEVIRELVLANRSQVSSTVDNFERVSATLAAELPKLSQQLQALVAQVDGVVAENRDALRGSLENVEELSAGLRTSVADLEQISGKIARGEGTVGKLVNSEAAHDQLVSTLESVEAGVDSLGETLGRVQKLKLRLGFEGYYLDGPQDTRSSFSLRLEPPSDRFYLVEVVDDPRGRTTSKTETITVTGPEGESETTVIETRKVEDDVTLSAQFGFELDRFRLRGGLFESTGGAAVDYLLLDRQVELSLEAFDFGRERGGVELDPRLRLLGRWNVHPNVYLLGGWDDFLVEDERSLFFGGGVRWTDDDLKYLLGSVPVGSF